MDVCDQMIEEKRFTYQATLISDSSDVYLILNYHALAMSGATTGYSIDEECRFGTFAPVTTSLNLQVTSNVGKKGVHLHHLTTKDCSHSGKMVGDSLICHSDKKTPEFFPILYLSLIHI